MLRTYLVILSLFLFAQANPIVEEFSNGNPMLGIFFIKFAFILLFSHILRMNIYILPFQGKYYQGDIVQFNYDTEVFI